MGSRAVVFFVALAASSACVLPRSMVVGVQPEVAPAAPNAPVVSWSVARVDFAYAAQANNGSDMAGVIDSTKLEAQVVDRLRATLAAQQPLGFREREGELSVSVEVKLTEHSGFGRQAGVAYAAEAALGLGGALIGALIGTSIDGAQPKSRSSGSGFVMGLGVGTGVGLHLGVLAALLFELNGANCKWEGKLTLRRDGRVVGERTFETKHRFDSNAFAVASKLAASTGQGIVEFEAELLRNLSGALVEVAPALTPAPMP